MDKKKHPGAKDTDDVVQKAKESGDEKQDECCEALKAECEAEPIEKAGSEYSGQEGKGFLHDVEQFLKSQPKFKEQPDKDKEIEDLKDTLQRIQADFENYKKHTDREKKRMCEYANSELIFKLLPIIDSFELALKNTADHEKFVKGMELIFSQMITCLEHEGLRPIDAAGKEFNPEYHDCLMKEKSGKEDIILEEFQKGYMLKDRVLRHSKVKVGY